MFRNKVAVVTGGANGIGKCICEEFEKAGAKVCVIDLAPNPYFVGDVGSKADLDRFVQKIAADYGKKETLEAFAEKIISECGRVDFLVNNAKPAMVGIDRCSFEAFEQALRVGVTGPFYLTQQLLPYFEKGGAVVNISSSRDRMSQPNTESYSAAKGGIAALTHAMAVSLGSKLRVNAVAPGWIDTTNTHYEGADAAQHPVGRVGNPQDIAQLVLFLCSEKAGFITGQNICVDGGMTAQMIYHDDNGWKLEG